MKITHGERVRRSAEWAAYGDALGFMTELADVGRVQYRTGADLVLDTTDWKRKVGGYNGVTTDLPAGTYSDDTQLRLATSRAIRSDGTFDVAAFAKVELPAWANYALGAGVGTKEAASNLARTSATWYSNFFDNARASYVRAGGNGAAMRVQPHVWAARDLSDVNAILLDVVRNSLCTHGHPRGILGACFHALALTFAMREGRPAKMTEVRQIIDRLGSLPDVISQNGDLRLLWLGAWEKTSGTTFKDGVAQATQEMMDDVDILKPFEGNSLTTVYAQAVEAISATDPSRRGSGTKTALLASFACSSANIADPKSILLTLINALGSDTDSIATMAGAILGVCTEQECEGPVQDRDYILLEAERMAAIAIGESVSSFRYPDLRSWKPARAAVDAIGIVNGRLRLNGLGELEPIERFLRKEVGDDTVGWYRLEFGQTILARVRSNPHSILRERLAPDRQGDKVEERAAASPPGRLRDLFGQEGARSALDRTERPVSLGGLTLNESLHRIIASGFSPEMVGHALLQQVDVGGTDFMERAIALAATIVTAYDARSKRRK